MQTYLKTKPVWVQILLFIGMAFGLTIMFGFISLAIVSSITGIDQLVLADPDYWDWDDPGLILYIKVSIILQFLMFFLIPSLMMAFFSDPKPFKYIGIKSVRKPVYWLFAIVLLLLSIPFVEFIGSLNRDINFGSLQSQAVKMETQATKTIQLLLNQPGIDNLLINLLFIAVFAGVGEELFFRGILQRLFIKWTKDPWMGIVIAAFIFSFFHFQFFGFFPRFILGILLGALYWYSGSLWPSIIAHTIYNAFTILMIYFKPQLLSNPEVGMVDKSNLAWAGLVSALIMGIIIWQMKKQSTTTYEEVYADDNVKPSEKDLSF